MALAHKIKVVTVCCQQGQQEEYASFGCQRTMTKVCEIDRDKW